MRKKAFSPLRRTIGSPVKIAKGKGDPAISLVTQSNKLRSLGLDYKFLSQMNTDSAGSDVGLARYIPHLRIDEGVYARPGRGMADFSYRQILPSDLTECVALFAYPGQSVTHERGLSRELSLKLFVELERETLLGGICFGGLPFLPSDLGSHGRNLRNFGLPREIRIILSGSGSGSIESFVGSEFLDLEHSVTRQEITSHSGAHYLLVEPTLTKNFVLHLSDLPRFSKVLHPSAPGASREDDFYGFVIPYLWAFEYGETCRYKSFVPCGTLGTKRIDTQRARPDIVVGTHETVPKRTTHGTELHRVFPGEGGEHHYFSFIAHSAVAQSRRFRIPDTEGHSGTNWTECFISTTVERGDRVVIYLEQSEEHVRCLAGIKALFPLLRKIKDEENIHHSLANLSDILRDSGEAATHVDEFFDLPRDVIEEAIREKVLGIPPDICTCESIGVRVFELDPPKGVSPVNLSFDGEYATLLAEEHIDELSEVALAYWAKGIRFQRTSTSRYLALELTNSGNDVGHFVLRELELAQSAHVSVHPRAARNRHVNALHFRLIGPNLADDYARLGPEGFHFAVERVVAGQTTEILFQAHSLLDLLHGGSARIFANSRRPAIEEEWVAVAGEAEENYEARRTTSDGWRRTVTGESVDAKELEEAQWSTSISDFVVHSSNETRTHSEVLSPQEDDQTWKSQAICGNIMNSVWEVGNTAKIEFEELKNAVDGGQYEVATMPFLGSDQTLIPTYEDIKLYTGWEHVWKGTVETDNSLKVKGMTIVSGSPFGATRFGKEFLDLIDAVNAGDFSSLVYNTIDVLPAITALTANAGGPFALTAVNSLGMGVNVSPGGFGMSFSAPVSGGQLVPSISYHNSFGTQGLIAHQASKTGSSYAQFRNRGEDDTTSTIVDAESRRTIERRPLEGEDVDQERARERVSGVDVRWQGETADIVVGTIPLGLTLPATARRSYYATSDESVRIRIGGGERALVDFDFWFDMMEEGLRDVD